MLHADDIKGVYAIVPTPAKEGADHWSATDTVDLDESARMIDRLIADGVDAIIALGTTGECATLTENEPCQLSVRARFSKACTHVTIAGVASVVTISSRLIPSTSASS